jgi:integrase
MTPIRLLRGVDDDIHHYDRKLDNQLRLLKEEGFPQSEKTLVKDYATMLEARGLNKGRISKAIFLLRQIRQHLACDFARADKKQIEVLLIWINNNPQYGAWTRSDAKGLLKRFYRWLRTGKYEGPYPDEVSDVRAGVKLNEIEEPDILTVEEIETMIKVADKPRDKAFIAAVFEGGFRIGEMLRMTIGSVSFDDHGARVLVKKGKTGGRPVRLITSAPLLSSWAEMHPMRRIPSAPLWPSLDHNSKGKGLAYQSAREIIADSAAKAGIRKRTYPHLARHTAATRDARFLNEAELRIKYGWARGSKIPATYVHLAGRDVEEKLIAFYAGGKTKPVEPEFVPVVCARCGERNSPGVRFCAKCGTPLDPAELARSGVEVEELKAKLDRLLERLPSDLGK